MFKNATLHRYSGTLHTFPQFAATLSTQQFSIGFIDPPGAGMHCVQLERRTVPSAQVNKRVDQLAASVEQQTGRKPGKAARREMADQALLELLPHAFPKQVKVLVWLRPDGLLVLDTATAGVADEVATLLAQCGLTIAPVQTNVPPGSLMTAWLHDRETDSDVLEFDGACSLQAEGSTGKAVRYKNADLTAVEVGGHIAAGLRCTSLALTWDEGEVGFTLTDGLVLKGLKFTVPFTGEWDGDVVLFKASMGALLDDLLAALQ